jgi:hypothetical protein
MQDFLWALETSVLAGGQPNPLATIANLAAWGVGPEVISDLEGLVARGMTEAVVVASFLSAVCHSPLRDQLERRTRIKILAIAKASAPDPALVISLTDALARADAQDWHWQSLALEAVVQL